MDVDVDSNQGEGPKTAAGAAESENDDKSEATQEPSEETPPAKSLSRMNRTVLGAAAAEIGLVVTDEHKTNKDLSNAINARQA